MEYKSHSALPRDKQEELIKKWQERKGKGADD